MRSSGTARGVPARACLSTGPGLTVVFLTFRVLAQGGGVPHAIFREAYRNKLITDGPALPPTPPPPAPQQPTQATLTVTHAKSGGSGRGGANSTAHHQGIGMGLHFRRGKNRNC